MIPVNITNLLLLQTKLNTIFNIWEKKKLFHIYHLVHSMYKVCLCILYLYFLCIFPSFFNFLILINSEYGSALSNFDNVKNDIT